MLVQLTLSSILTLALVNNVQATNTNPKVIGAAKPAAIAFGKSPLIAVVKPIGSVIKPIIAIAKQSNITKPVVPDTLAHHDPVITAMSVLLEIKKSLETMIPETHCVNTTTIIVSHGAASCLPGYGFDKNTCTECLAGKSSLGGVATCLTNKNLAPSGGTPTSSNTTTNSTTVPWLRPHGASDLPNHNYSRTDDTTWSRSQTAHSWSQSGVASNSTRPALGFPTGVQSTFSSSSKPTQASVTPVINKVIPNQSSNVKVSSNPTVPKSFTPKPTVTPVTKQIIHSGITVTGCASTDTDRYYDSPYLTSDTCASVPLSFDGYAGSDYAPGVFDFYIYPKGNLCFDIQQPTTLSIFNEGGFTSNLFNITCSQDGLTGTLILADPTMQLCQGTDATEVAFNQFYPTDIDDSCSNGNSLVLNFE